MLSIHLTPYAAAKVLIEAHHYFSHSNWAAPLCYGTPEENDPTSGSKTGVRLAPKKQPMPVLRENPMEQMSQIQHVTRSYKRTHPNDSYIPWKQGARTSPAVIRQEGSTGSVLPTKLSCSEFWKSMEHDYFETSLRFLSSDNEISPIVTVQNKSAFLSQGREIRYYAIWNDHK